ncbi:4-carboxymuconolactone decarboxylase [Neofusicoccum parvum]|uniref:4-carboxymuconolactone decarboxylase n=1 Tax=Neofusicoccum parvum TaxID=310453 RepID=A0ACB5RPJ6_9PEZI|nr:4-carboxymuconolactone decarboxylase [Neofusicoccum parvum]
MSPPTTDPPTPSQLAAAHATLHAAGHAMRRAVAGPAHVDRVLAATTSFGQPMQELATEAAWAHVWTRPGLSLRQRSLLNVAMLCALNRAPELAVHVRGAFANGCTETEVREALLQAAVYCGMPAGMEGFRVAERVLNECRAEGMVVEKGE